MTRMTQEQVNAHQARTKNSLPPSAAPLLTSAKRKTKHNNIRCTSADGVNFDSKLEMRYYENVLLPQFRTGAVLWFLLQPTFRLEGGVKYRADFLLVRRAQGDTREIEVIDCKGFWTQESKNKIKQVLARYGLTIQLVTKI